MFSDSMLCTRFTASGSMNFGSLIRLSYTGLRVASAGFGDVNPTSSLKGSLKGSLNGIYKGFYRGPENLVSRL